MVEKVGGINNRERGVVEERGSGRKGKKGMITKRGVVEERGSDRRGEGMVEERDEEAYTRRVGGRRKSCRRKWGIAV